MADTLTTAVEEAVEKEIPEEKPETQESEEEESEETEGEESDSEAEEPEEDDSAAAIQLYKALTNPKTSRGVLAALAEEAGLSIASKETTRAEAIQSATEVLRESLGKDYAFLADRLGPAIDKLLKNGTSDPKVERLERELAEIKQGTVMREINSALSDLYEKHPDAKDVEKQMLRLMDEVLPGPNTTGKAYIKHIYNLASEQSRLKSATKKTIDKMKANANDATRRASLEANATRVKSGSALPNLKEAVRAAIRGQKLE